MLLSHPVCPLSVSFCRPPYGPTPTIPLVTITLFFPPFDGGACPTSETTPEIILEGRRSTNFDAVDDVVMTSSMASLRLRRRSAAEPRLASSCGQAKTINAFTSPTHGLPTLSLMSTTPIPGLANCSLRHQVSELLKHQGTRTSVVWSNGRTKKMNGLRLGSR